jgi:hypothetical protein
MILRAALLFSIGASIAGLEGRAEACIRAGEADTLVGWSADGKYALYTLTVDKKLDHAEILPTSYSGYIYIVTGNEDGDAITVVRTKVGSCAEWPEDGGAYVEQKAGKLTEKSLMGLKTVKAMKFGKIDATTAAAPPATGSPAAAGASPAPAPATGNAAATPTTAVFTGKKRYDAHNIELTTGTSKLELPLPVFCVGSCLADENWTKWSISVDGVHALASGTTLYELSMANVCNGGTIHRLVTQTPAKVKVPKRRCMGSGQ